MFHELDNRGVVPTIDGFLCVCVRCRRVSKANKNMGTPQIPSAIDTNLTHWTRIPKPNSCFYFVAEAVGASFILASNLCKAQAVRARQTKPHQWLRTMSHISRISPLLKL